MGTFFEPPFGAVAVGTKELQSFFRPSSSFEISVEAPRKLLPILLSITRDMIDSEEVPIILATADTLTAVGDDYFLPKLAVVLFRVLGFSLGTFMAVFLPWTHWASATLQTNTSSRPLLPHYDHPCPSFLAAIVTE
ncbi:MAG: hypothetical protein IIB38_04550, partial [Candidatus Hydrogenedentes bacterium]|nr:hypothetical protein [Candidatus Hydrogenedentota bacterium]